MSIHQPGSLEAVARVRRVRERDSLMGLQQAIREVTEAQQRVTALESHLELVSSGTSENLDGFVAVRTRLLGVAQALTSAQETVESSRNLAAFALAHWQRDKSRLKAIEMLQGRRAEEARAWAARVEAKELDDIATQLWQRRDRAEVVA